MTKRILVPLDRSPLVESVIPLAEQVFRKAPVPVVLYRGGSDWSGGGARRR